MTVSEPICTKLTLARQGLTSTAVSDFKEIR